MGWVVNATLRPCYPRKWPSTHCVGGWVDPQGRSGRVHKISPPPKFDPRTAQSVASRYAHCAGEWGEYNSHCSRGMSTNLYLAKHGALLSPMTWRICVAHCFISVQPYRRHSPWVPSYICNTTGDWRLQGSTQQPPLRKDHVAVRIVIMFTILVAGHRRETLLNQSGHHLSTGHQKPNSYKRSPPTTQNSFTLNIVKYNVYRNVYDSSLYVVERPSDALYEYISLKRLKDLQLKNQGTTHFRDT